MNNRNRFDIWKIIEDVLNRDDMLSAYDYKTDTIRLWSNSEENPITDEEKELIKTAFEQRLPGIGVEFKS